MQRTNEEELELFADLLDPAAEIFSDSAIVDVFRNGGKPIDAVKLAVKNHKTAIIEILARIDNVPVEEYQVNVMTIPVKLIGWLNKPETKDLFSFAGQMNSAASSGSAMENTEDEEN